MTLFKIILLLWLIFGVVLDLYNTGAYAHGKTELRKGIRYTVLCFISALITALFALGIWLGW